MRSGALTLHYKLETEDLYQANKLVIQKASTRKVKFFRVLIWFIIVAYLFLALTSLLDGEFAMVGTYLLVVFLFMAMTGIFLRSVVNNQYRQILHYQEATRLTIDDEGLTTENKYFTYRLKWPSVKKVFSNDKVLTIHPFDAVFAPIPRSAVKSDKEWQELIELIKGKATPQVAL